MHGNVKKVWGWSVWGEVLLQKVRCMSSLVSNCQCGQCGRMLGHILWKLCDSCGIVVWFWWWIDPWLSLSSYVSLRSNYSGRAEASPKYKRSLNILSKPQIQYSKVARESTVCIKWTLLASVATLPMRIVVLRAMDMTTHLPLMTWMRFRCPILGYTN